MGRVRTLFVKKPPDGGLFSLRQILRINNISKNMFSSKETVDDVTKRTTDDRVISCARFLVCDKHVDDNITFAVETFGKEVVSLVLYGTSDWDVSEFKTYDYKNNNIDCLDCVECYGCIRCNGCLKCTDSKDCLDSRNLKGCYKIERTNDLTDISY